MSEEVSHLTAGAVELLGETDERRMRAIRSRRWVLYPRAKQALDRLTGFSTFREELECLLSRSMATAAWARRCS